jgi:hypothetical protein
MAMPGAFFNAQTRFENIHDSKTPLNLSFIVNALAARRADQSWPVPRCQKMHIAGPSPALEHSSVRFGHDTTLPIVKATGRYGRLPDLFKRMSEIQTTV